MAESTMVLVVREAVVGDAGGVASSHVRAWQEGYRDVIPEDFLEGLRRDLPQRTARWQAEILASESDGRVVLVGVADGKIAGWLTAGACRDPDVPSDRVGEVYGCYVDPAHWRRGVGSALMVAGLGRLAAAGYDEAVLWVLEENPRARAFYERHGWVADGIRKPFEIAGISPAELRYRRPLSPS